MIFKSLISNFTKIRHKYTLIAVTNCGLPPPPPLRGGYAFDGTEYGDQVTYDCECGYDLEGDQVLTCGETGEWGPPPCCFRK